MIERLEADLGVKVQQVQIPEFKYAFQIWAAMMSSKNADGKVSLFLVLEHSIFCMREIAIEVCYTIIISCRLQFAAYKQFLGTANKLYF